jgi:hypothetical protein
MLFFNPHPKSKPFAYPHTPLSPLTPSSMRHSIFQPQATLRQALLTATPSAPSSPSPFGIALCSLQTPPTPPLASQAAAAASLAAFASPRQDMALEFDAAVVDDDDDDDGKEPKRPYEFMSTMVAVNSLMLLSGFESSYGVTTCNVDSKLALALNEKLMRTWMPVIAGSIIEYANKSWRSFGSRKPKSFTVDGVDAQRSDPIGGLLLDDGNHNTTRICGFSDFDSVPDHEAALQVKMTALAASDKHLLALFASFPEIEVIKDSVLKQHSNLELGWIHLFPQGIKMNGQSLSKLLQTRYSWHLDTESENGSNKQRPKQKDVQRTVVVKLTGGQSSMQVAGCPVFEYDRQAGGGGSFNSALWHRSCSTEDLCFKAVFFLV